MRAGALRMVLSGMMCALAAGGCGTTGGTGRDTVPRSEQIMDSFVVLGAWEIDMLGSRGSVEVTPDGLLVAFDILRKPPRDKCVITIPVQISLATQEGIMVDVDNRSPEPTSVALAVEAAQDGYFESRPRRVKGGPNKDVFFDLRASTYKSASSNWKHSVRPTGLARTTRLRLVIYSKGKGKVLFQNFRILSQKRPHAAPPTVLLPVVTGGKWGYANAGGRIVIRTEFDRAYPFSGSLAVVRIKDKYGYVWSDGKIVIKPRFDEAGPFVEGRACVRIEDKWGYIGRNGRFVIKARYDDAGRFCNGLARVSVDGKYGYINVRGKELVKPQYESAHDFSEGLAGVMRERKWGFVENSGRMVIQPQYDMVGSFYEGRAAVRVGEKWGYIDRQSRMRIDPSFSLVRRYAEGLAPVEVDGKWGYLRKSGKFAVEPTFDMAEPFSEGLAAVMIRGRWGYIDRSGLVSIAPIFDLAMPFRDGVAMIQMSDGRTGAMSGYIDETGQYVVLPNR